MKVSNQEVQLMERIFMLELSLSLLKQGRRPFHREAIGMIKNKIKELKNTK